MGLAIRDTLAYIPYAYDTLFVYSIADPTDLRMLSAVPAGIWPSDAALGESKVYVSSASGIDVYDLSNPAQPVHVGNIIGAAPVLRLNYVDGLLYAMLQQAGVAIYETTAVGIQELPASKSKSRGLGVWPTITCGMVRFAVDAAKKNRDVSVYDVSGRLLRHMPVQVQTKGGASEGLVDLGGLADGVYVLRVKSEGTNLTTSVVKTNRR
jgi:hypothetical protein